MSSEKNKGKPILPPGWVIRQSSSYPDMIYYFNTISGATTWQMPQLIAKADSTMPRSNAMKKSKHSKRGGTKVTFLKKSVTSDVTVSSSNEVKKRNDGRDADLLELKKKRRALIRQIQQTEEEEKPPLSDKTTLLDSPEEKTVGDKTTAFGSPEKIIYNKTLFGPIEDKPVYSKTLLGAIVKKPVHNKNLFSPKDRKLIYAEQVKNKKYALKRKSLDGMKIMHKRTCSKFKKNQAKRQNKSQPSDIEMEDVSDVVKELSPIPQLKSPLKDNPSQAYYVVVDTNILIHDLTFVDELKDKPLQGHGPPIIVVPWIVLQELDAIKTNKNSLVNLKTEPPKRAGEAIKFLNTMLMAQHPRIRGQSYALANQEIASLKPKCNDDRVLHCCLQLIEVSGIPRDRVVLLTNDKNLCNKALISEVKAHTTDSILNDFQVDFCPVTKRPSVYSAFANLPESQQVERIAEVKAEVDEIICRMKSILKETFSSILEMEMKLAYQDSWLTIVSIQPPWSFLDILECFKKHWYAVFNFAFSRSMLENMETLRTTMRATKGYIRDEHQASRIISAALALCTHIESKYTEMPSTVKELKNLQEQLQLLCERTKAEPQRPTKEIKDSKGVLTMDEKHKQIMEVFQHTWCTVNALCGTILDALGHPHNYKYQPPSIMPTKKETVDFVQKLYRPLRHLTQSMLNVMRSVLAADGSLYSTANDFYKSLTNFLPDLELPMPIPISFTAKDLEDFCRNPAKKELLENGQLQLIGFYNSIHQSVNSLSLTIS